MTNFRCGLGDDLAAVCVAAAKEMYDGQDVTISVSSPGGEVLPVLEVIHAARATGRDLTVRASVLCASAASLLVAGATRSYLAPGTGVMVHAPWAFSVGTADDLRDQADSLDVILAAMREVYSAGALRRGAQDDWVYTLKGDNWMSANKAVEMGIADAVLDPSGKAAEDAAPVVEASVDVEAGEVEQVEQGEEVADAASELETVREELAKLQSDLAALQSELEQNREHLAQSAAQVEDLKAENVKLRADAADREEQKREELREEAVAEAVATGRIAPSARDGWLAALRRDDTMVDVLSALPQSLPVARKISPVGDDAPLGLAERFAKVMSNG